MEDLNSIYSDIIIEQSTATYNKHELVNASDSEHGHNPSCGDDITLQIILENNKIKDLAFQGHGCAISQASTSIMIDLLKGKTREDALKIIDIFLRMIKREEIPEAELDLLEDAQSLKNISNMPARVKCAELAWYTMQKLLDKNDNNIENA